MSHPIHIGLCIRHRSRKLCVHTLRGEVDASPDITPLHPFLMFLHHLSHHRYMTTPLEAASNTRRPDQAGQCPQDDRNSRSDNPSPSRSAPSFPPLPSPSSSDDHGASRSAMSSVEDIAQSTADQRYATRSDMNVKQRVASTTFDR